VRDYLTCFVFIKDCTVKSCYAKGWGQSGDGGAICAVNSQVKIENDQFEGNEANTGGSIAAYNSHIIIVKTTFEKDIGYIAGGSLFVAGKLGQKEEEEETEQQPESKHIMMSHLDVPSSTEPYFCQIINTSFAQSCGFEFYGGAFFLKVPEILFQNVLFEECHARTAGGAMGLVDSSAYLKECKFIHNYCSTDKHEIWPYQPKAHSVNLIKGGGAIYFTSPNQPKDWWNYTPQLELVTEECEFVCNYVKDIVYLPTPPEGQSAKKDYQTEPGHDILFYKTAYYRSYKDKFSWTKNLSYTLYPKTESLKLVEYDSLWYNKTFADDERCDDSIPSGVSWKTTTEISTDPSESEEVVQYSDEGEPMKDTGNTNPFSEYEIPSTTQSHYFHTTPSLLTKYPFFQFQSPTQSLYPSPTCSTGDWVGPDPVVRTHITPHVTPSYYWEPTPSPKSTVTPAGFEWPDQTPYPIPEQTNPGFLPNLNLPTASWWGEKVSPPTRTPTFYKEPDPTLAPEARPTNLGPAPIGMSYVTVQLTVTQSVSFTASNTVTYLIVEDGTQAESYTQNGEFISNMLTITQAVLVDTVVPSEVNVTKIFISTQFSLQTPSVSLEPGKQFVDVNTKTEGITFVASLTQTATLLEKINCTEEDGQEICETIYIATNGIFPTYIGVATVYDLHVQSVVQDPPSKKDLPGNLIVYIAAALAAVALAIAAGVLYMLRKLHTDNQNDGDDCDSTPSEVDDENDGVTATIDVPNEEIDETMNEVDNWL